jgi:hypothetical protein
VERSGEWRGWGDRPLFIAKAGFMVDTV